MKVLAKDVKKMDVIATLEKERTVNKIILSKGSPFCVIVYMDQTKTRCLANDLIEVKRYRGYAVTHKEFVNENDLLL